MLDYMRLMPFKNIIGWGSGSYYRDVRARGGIDANIEFIVDIDDKKWGMTIDGIEIRSPDSLKCFNGDDVLIVVFSSFIDDIKKYLNRAGYINIVEGKDWDRFYLEMLNKQIRDGVVSGIGLENLSRLYREKIIVLKRAGSKGPELREVLKDAQANLPDDGYLCGVLGDILFFDMEYHSAALQYSKALAADPSSAIRWYRYGYVNERLGFQGIAKTAYAEAARRHAIASQVGLGFFQYQHGRWLDAAHSLEDVVHQHSLGALCDFKLGKAYERVFRLESAIQAYRRAINGHPHYGYWHYRLGIALERANNLPQAEKSYRAALALSPKRRDWCYRLGYVLAKQGAYQEGAKHLMRYCDGAVVPHAVNNDGASGIDKMALELSIDSSDHLLWRRYGMALENAGRLDDAVYAYRASIDRSTQYDRSTYILLGKVLLSMGEFEKCCNALLETRIFKRASTVIVQEGNNANTYIEYLETLSIRDEVIIYESGGGISVACNPYALLLQIDDAHGREFVHYVVINDKSFMPDGLRGKRNVIPVVRGSNLYWRTLATARYVICNATLPQEYVRREGQAYLFTWHGTPMKTLGRDYGGAFLKHGNITRNLLQASHIISQCRHMTNCVLDGHDVRGLVSGAIYESGYPRNDITVSATDEQKNRIRRRLGIREGVPVVLYAPTWRGAGYTKVDFESDKLTMDLTALSEIKGFAYIMFRGHPLLVQYGKIKRLPDSVVVPSLDVATNDLLAITDILITDYSSIVFDFFATGRPVIYYTYDYNEYVKSSGHCIDINQLPGTSCFNIVDLCCRVEEELTVLRSGNVDYKNAKQKYCPYDDGLSGKRVVEWFINDRVVTLFSDGISELPVLLVAGSIECADDLNLVIERACQLEMEGDNVVIALDPMDVTTSDGVRKVFESKFPRRFKVICKVGGILMSVDEKWLFDLYLEGGVLKEQQKPWLFNALNRERRRCFGETRFSKVEYIGSKNAAWRAIVSASEQEAPSKSPAA